jgi:hypothetical protein
LAGISICVAIPTVKRISGLSLVAWITRGSGEEQAANPRNATMDIATGDFDMELTFKN